jgi:hypothetical protein
MTLCWLTPCMIVGTHTPFVGECCIHRRGERRFLFVKAEVVRDRGYCVVWVGFMQ